MVNGYSLLAFSLLMGMVIVVYISKHFASFIMGPPPHISLANCSFHVENLEIMIAASHRKLIPFPHFKKPG